MNLIDLQDELDHAANKLRFVIEALTQKPEESPIDLSGKALSGMAFILGDAEKEVEDTIKKLDPFVKLIDQTALDKILKVK